MPDSLVELAIIFFVRVQRSTFYLRGPSEIQVSLHLHQVLMNPGIEWLEVEGFELLLLLWYFFSRFLRILPIFLRGLLLQSPGASQAFNVSSWFMNSPILSINP